MVGCMGMEGLAYLERGGNVCLWEAALALQHHMDDVRRLNEQKLNIQPLDLISNCPFEDHSSQA